MENNQSPPKSIFILSGQSNMSGRGGVVLDHHTHKKHWDGIVPPECRPSPSIYRLSDDLAWEPARDPLHADIDRAKVCGVGPGMPFANSILGRADAIVGLVPCAVGATAIKEWARGERLYENMVRRSRKAVEGGEAVIKAVLWYQGESDTSSEHDADVYKANLERLIHDLRADLGIDSLPFIQVGIASGDGKYIHKVREAQKAIDLPNVVCVDAKGLQLKEDNLHLTTEAQVHLGRMLADAYFANFVSGALSTAS